MPEYVAVSTSDRQGFDRRFYADNPDLTVFRPTSSQDVVAAMQTIAANDPSAVGHEVQITSGRHCYEGFVYNSDTKYLIDVTGLRQFGMVSFKDQADVVYIGSGYGNWDMYRMMQNVYGKTLPAGSCYSVGLGGHLTGGGYGVLSRLAGLAIDYIYGFEIVIDNGGGSPEKKTVTRDSIEQQDLDIYWALRGIGGGQIGVITKYYFVLDELPTSPSLMATTSFSWDWGQGGTTLTEQQFANLVTTFYSIFCDQDENTWKVWAAFHATHVESKRLSCPAIVFNSADSEVSDEEFRREVDLLISTWTERFNAVVPLSAEDHPINGHPHISSRSLIGIATPGETEQPTARIFSYLDGTQQLNGSGENQHGKYKSAYHNFIFEPEMLKAMYTGLTTSVEGIDLSQARIQMDSYGGKTNEVGSEETAIPQRSSTVKLQYQTYWKTPGLLPGQQDQEVEEKQLNWINTMYSNVYAATGGIPVNQNNPAVDDVVTTDGCYYNYPDIYIGSRLEETADVKQAWELYFGTTNSERLQKIAAECNPLGWFTNSQTFQYK